MATDATNIAVIGTHATTAQALAINHGTRYDATGTISGVYIEDVCVPVDSIAFADLVAPLVHTSRAELHAADPHLWDHDGRYIG